MKVAQVYLPKVIRIASNQPLSRAAWRMREFEIGAVLVLDEGELVGIVTEHDLLRAAADGVSPHDVIVRDYMTQFPGRVGIDEDIADAAAKMVALRARHLPVEEAGRIVGVVSARDLLSVLAERAASRPKARHLRSATLVDDRPQPRGAREVFG